MNYDSPTIWLFSFARGIYSLSLTYSGTEASPAPPGTHQGCHWDMMKLLAAGVGGTDRLPSVPELGQVLIDRELFMKFDHEKVVKSTLGKALLHGKTTCYD